MSDERLKFSASPSKTINVQPPFGSIVTRQGRNRHPVPSLRFEPNARRVGRRVQMLVARAVLWRARHANRDRDASAAAAVRLGKEMAADGSAEPLGNLMRPRRRCAQECHKLVTTRMGDELTLSEVGPSQIENRSQDPLGVGFAVIARQPPIVIDVRDEQRDRPAAGTRLGNGCRSGVDKGVVRRESSLLVEKNGLLLQGAGGGGFVNRKSGRRNDAREKIPFWLRSLRLGSS